MTAPAPGVAAVVELAEQLADQAIAGGRREAVVLDVNGTDDEINELYERLGPLHRRTGVQFVVLANGATLP